MGTVETYTWQRLLKHTITLTSNKVRSLPPVMFHTIPVALSIPISSKGDWIAFNAASLALVFPWTHKKCHKINSNNI